jgi:hypothetical protein
MIHNVRHWKGWALEIKTFLGPEMAMSATSAIWSQKLSVHENKYMTTPSDAPSNGFVRLKTIKYKLHMKKQAYW